MGYLHCHGNGFLEGSILPNSIIFLFFVVILLFLLINVQILSILHVLTQCTLTTVYYVIFIILYENSLRQNLNVATGYCDHKFYHSALLFYVYHFIFVFRLEYYKQLFSFFLYFVPIENVIYIYI